MNYQTCYGVESLTESETCRLWAESLIHSNCVLHVGHVDALTSKFFILEEVTAEKLKEKISALKPANCLNTLRHILKWVTGLQDGSYLLSHVSGDSSVCLYKSAAENKRGTYNLQEAHQKPTNKPSFASVPWVPLNPNLLLNYHIQHGRPPCTFPPAPDVNTGKAKPLHGGGVTPQTPPFLRSVPAVLPDDGPGVWYARCELNPQRIIAPPSENNTKTTNSPKKKKGRNRLKRLKEKQKLWKSQAALQGKT